VLPTLISDDVKEVMVSGDLATSAFGVAVIEIFADAV
jgi:hypothetical protein